MYQVFDIIAEGVLKPSELCDLLHFCNGSNGTVSDTYLHVPSLLVGQSGAATLRNSAHRSTGKQSERDNTHLGSDARFKMTSGLERGKKEDDTIVFLHLSDIHLDRQYSEVYILYVKH